MPTTSQKKGIYKTSDRDLDVAFSGPAVSSNYFYATLAPQGLRIAFTEQSNEGHVPVFRTAVMLSVEDGEGLYRLLKELFEEADKTWKIAK